MSPIFIIFGGMKLRRILFLAAVIFAVYESLRIPFLLLDGRESLANILRVLPADAFKCLVLATADCLLLWHVIARVSLAQWGRWRVALAIVGIFFFNLAVSLPLWGAEWLMAGRYAFAAHLRDMYVMACLASLVINARLLIWIADALQRQERLLATAQLQLLRGQLDPHFLFNSLSTGISLIDTDPALAADYLLCLSKSLRYVLDSGMREKVELDHERKSIEPYLTMLRMRFGPALRIDWHTDGMGHALLPAGALLLVFENIAKHNLFSPDRPIEVDVTATADRLTVTNTLRPAEADSSYGIGSRSLLKAFANLGHDSVIMRAEGDRFITSFPLE